MRKKLSNKTKNELISALRKRYINSSRNQKTKIINEVIEMTYYHRKHVIRLLTEDKKKDKIIPLQKSRRVYTDAIKEALILIWEAADRICSKRLKAAIPLYIESMELHNHLDIDLNVKNLLLNISASTIDRLLSEARNSAKPKKRNKSPKKLTKKIAVKTFTEWTETQIGYMEIDFVVHCGTSMSGKYIHTLVSTDVCTGWTEFIPMLAKSQSLVIECIGSLKKQLPFILKGINSDNDSAFINETLYNFCTDENITFTRSRPYKKNDQAWVEQKNGSIIRKYIGYDRLSGLAACQLLSNLYYYLRYYINYFQPTFKLQEKHRTGSKVNKKYYKPETPIKRVLNNPGVDDSIKKVLEKTLLELDTITLLHKIRNHQKQLVKLISSNEYKRSEDEETIEEFMEKLPQLWKENTNSPLEQKKECNQRHWRTRIDPFAKTWPTILMWLQEEPDSTAKELFKRLQKREPGEFTDGQLRTLQRRIKEWRKEMARKLVYFSTELTIEENNSPPEIPKEK